jgi:type II secretory pathway component PulJ
VHGVAPPQLRAAQAGISLVETLVALVLGLAMVSVAFNLYVSNRAVFRQIEAMVRLQESASIAAALLETNIRHAAGTLCRNNPPTTVLVRGASTRDYKQHNPQIPARYWEVDGLLGESLDSHQGQFGWHAYESTRPDAIVGSARLAGASISIMSDNMGAVARVTGLATHTSSNFGLTGSYTFPVDNGTKFPVGTVAMACDYTRAVLFQVTGSTASTITLQANMGASPSPGNCAVTMRRRVEPGEAVAAMDGNYRCAGGSNPTVYLSSMYTFGPGSMIGEHTFNHWYIGKKTSTSACCSLRRFSTAYNATGVDTKDEEILENVTDMQITYLQGLLYTGYPFNKLYYSHTELVENFNYSYRGVTAVRITLTLTSPEKVGLAANNAASAATYTIPINVAIRARMPGVVRR